MRLLKGETSIKFMAKRKLAIFISIILIIISIGSLVVNGLNFGIDFTGGTLIEVGFAKNHDLNTIRDVMSDNELGESTIQNFGSIKDVLIRIAPQEGINSAELSSKVLDVLKQVDANVEMRRVEFVGPQVGDELTEDGGLAILFSLIAILIYVWFRFEWRFSIGSIVALVHDVLITLGIFSLLQIDFDLPVLAAILAVIGYSLNDTIVVYDRIRENFRKIRKGSSEQIIDTSLNQTLSRTLMTSVTTLLVLLSLFLLGGEIIHGFALALIIGVLVGTYSSVYIASSSILFLGISRADLAIPQKENADYVDAEP